MIIEVNEHFARMSGFTQKELQGRAHNVVRHPDMPQEAFRDLWENLKQGRNWRGIIKNWNKDGGYYWVMANVSALRDKDRRIVGYQSVRFKPTQEDISKAETAYKKINAGDKSLTVVHGRIVKNSWLINQLRSPWVNWGLFTLLAFLPLLFRAFSLSSWFTEIAIATLLSAIAGRFIWKKHRSTQAFIQWMARISREGRLKTNKPKALSADASISEIGDDVLDFVSGVHVTMTGIEDISKRVSEMANQAQQSVDQMVNDLKRQAEIAVTAAAAIEEMSVSMVDIASQTQQTNHAVHITGQNAQQAEKDSQQTRQKIHQLADSIQHTSHEIEQLNTHSKAIEEILHWIVYIAEQTQLLALNASIEAARAGDQGRGFAVVADEVRQLSQRTTQATKDIADVIKQVHHSIKNTTESITQSQAQAEGCLTDIDNVAQSLTDISQTMNDTVARVEQITHILGEQKSVISGLAHETAQSSHMSENSLIAANQANKASKDLTQLNERMLESVRQYQV